MDKESPEEKLEKVQIQKIEDQRLERVFEILWQSGSKIGPKDIMTILK